MKNEMLINVSEGEECRIALLEDGRLEELYMERTSATSHVGNIYKGRVTNVEPSIQAAFVDFGLGRNGFLHISDLMPSYFGRRGEEIHETVGRKMARRDRPPIQRCLRRGDEIVVQIIKEGIGTKGPTLNTYLSIPGRILVMMPGIGKMGVSRKIEDEDERRRLRQILDSLEPPKDVGFIIRTAGIGKSKTEIQRDLTYLTRLWQTLEKKRDSGPAPMELYTEGDLVTRTVRDYFNTEIDSIIVDNKEVAKRVKEVIKLANPRARNKVELYEDPVPLFHRFGIERDIELMYSRHVPLPSGGSLVIDSTEAIVAIDVNSGKNRDHRDAETTAFKTDMEAADEIPRQLRLRDLGGVIICDFIDLVYERHRRELEKRLHDNFKNDRAKTKVLRMSQFGIIEMTRQRMRPSLKRSIYFDCPHCKGAGLVKTPESMSLDAMRRLAIAVSDKRAVRVELSVCPDVAFYLQNRKRRQIAELEQRTGKRVVVRSDLTLGLDEMRLDPFDAREGLVIIEELGTVLSPPPHITQLGTRPPAPPPKRGGRIDDRHRPTLPARLPPPRQAPDEPTDFESADDVFEEREDHFEEVEMDASHGERDERDARDARDERDEYEGRTSPTLDTEAASEAAEPAGESGAETESPRGLDDEPGEGGRRRRRRRRGRRGRGRGGEQAAASTPQAPGDVHSGDSSPVSDEREDFEDEIREPRQIAEFDEESVEVAVNESDEMTDDEPARDEPGGAEPLGESGIEGEGEAAPRRRRRRRGGRGRRRRSPAAVNGEEPPAAPVETPPALSPPIVQRTGSTDRHLIHDEPILPEPLPRPRSYRDLDQIPDDLD
jgi:ribonuclease E